MKTITISTEKMFPHPYHQKVYESGSTDSLKLSFKRTDGEPVYPIVVVPMVTEPDAPDLYWVVSGVNRLKTLTEMGITETDVIVKDISDEKSIKNMTIDLNKQRIKSGRERKMEFRHYSELHTDNRGKKVGCRYSKIGKEIGATKFRVKDLLLNI